MLHMKRCSFACNMFYFELVILTMLLLFLGLAERSRNDQGCTRRNCLRGLSQNTVDAEIAKIVNKKLCASDDLTTVDDAPGATSGDAGQEERVELRIVTYYSKDYFVCLVNFYLPCVGFASSQACVGSATALIIYTKQA
jgi:hypothetical protein